MRQTPTGGGLRGYEHDHGRSSGTGIAFLCASQNYNKNVCGRISVQTGTLILAGAKIIGSIA